MVQLEQQQQQVSNTSILSHPPVSHSLTLTTPPTFAYQQKQTVRTEKSIIISIERQLRMSCARNQLMMKVDAAAAELMMILEDGFSLSTLLKRAAAETSSRF